MQAIKAVSIARPKSSNYKREASGILAGNRETYYRLYAEHLKGGGFQENIPAGAIIWGADRIDRIDSKSMQPSETLGLLAIFYQ